MPGPSRVDYPDPPLLYPLTTHASNNELAPRLASVNLAVYTSHPPGLVYEFLGAVSSPPSNRLRRPRPHGPRPRCSPYPPLHPRIALLSDPLRAVAARLFRPRVGRAFGRGARRARRASSSSHVIASLFTALVRELPAGRLAVVPANAHTLDHVIR